MSIKKISLTNYKCFDKVSLSLNNFNVIIGPNASGKSSLIQIFKFLKDFDDYGLDNAISLQGGVEYFRNINIGHNKNFSLSISVEGRDSLAGMGKDKPVLIERKNLDYNLELKFLKNSKRYTVINENLTQFVEFFRFNEKERKLTKEHSLGKGEIVINRKNNKIYRNYNLPSLEKNINIEELTPPFLKGLSIPNNDSMLSFPFVSYPFPPRIFENIKIYDFEPRLSKKAIPFTGENELQEDGENLAIILNTLFKNRENKRKFLNLVKDILPFFEDSKTEKLTDKSFIFSLREKYLKSSKKYLLSSFLSDGTINILGLIIALFFPT